MEQVKNAFGVSQIEAGINENVYRLEEWHHALVTSGFELVTFEAAVSFNAVYERLPQGKTARALTPEHSLADLFAAYYAVEFEVPGQVSASAGTALQVPLIVRNRASGAGAFRAS